MPKYDYGVNGEIKLNADQFNKTMNDLKKAHADFERQFIDQQNGVDKSFKKTETVADKMGKGIKSSFLKQMAVANLASTAITAGLNFMKQGMGDVVKESLKLENSLKKISTITQGTSFSTGIYRDELFRASEATGYFASDLAEASYQALSAGVEVENLGVFIGQMAELATGGFTDVTNATDATTSVMNAYGKEVYNVNEIADKFIATQNRGKLTVDELGKSVSLFIPTAAQMGISLDEILASMASITRVGVPAQMAATQLNRVMVELMDTTSGAGKTFKEISGQGFPDFVKSGGTMIQALGMLRDRADATGEELLTMFGRVEAGKAAIVLTKNDMQDYNGSLKTLTESAGAAKKANEIMLDTFGKQWTIYKSSILNDLSGITTGLTKMVTEWLKQRNRINKELKKDEVSREIRLKRENQLIEKYLLEGNSKWESAGLARLQIKQELNKMGSEAFISMTEEKGKPYFDEQAALEAAQTTYTAPGAPPAGETEAERLKRVAEEARKQKILDENQAKIDAENAAAEKKEADKLARETEKKELEEFRNSQSIVDQDFKSEQLQKEIDFFNQTQALKDENKLTEEEEKQLQTEFDMKQLEDLNNFRMESIEREQNFYKDKENFAVQYNKSLMKQKSLELKILEDAEKKKKQMQKEEQEFKKEHGSFIKSSYRELVLTNQNMGKVLANIAKQRLQQYMIENGEELAVDGTTHVVKGTAKFLSNAITAPPIASEGLAEVKGGLGELAQAAVWGAAASAISVDTEVGGASDEYEADRKDREEEEIRDATLEKEERQTVTYILPKENKALYEAMIPGLDQAMKDNKNIIFVGEE